MTRCYLCLCGALLWVPDAWDVWECHCGRVVTRQDAYPPSPEPDPRHATREDLDDPDESLP